jgi:MtN3 and saliva related transmembrane protein
MEYRILGYVGCSLLSLQAVPQVWRIYKNKSAKDLSYATLGVSSVGCGLTIAYGVLIGEPPIYATVSFSMFMNAVVFALKVLYANRAGDHCNA